MADPDHGGSVWGAVKLGGSQKVPIV